MKYTKKEINLMKRNTDLFVENRKLKRIINEQDQKLMDLSYVGVFYELLLSEAFDK